MRPPSARGRRASTGRRSRLRALACRAQEQDADQSAEGSDDEPVAAELAARRGVGNMHAGFRRERGLADAEVDDRLAHDRPGVLDELVRGSRTRGIAIAAADLPELSGEAEHDSLTRYVLEHEPGKVGADERRCRISGRPAEPSDPP